MKKLLLFASVFLLSQLLLSQDNQAWKWSHEKPQGNYLRWVKMWDNNNWYAVGYSGTFMKTTNAGVTWTFTHRAGVTSTDSYGDLYCAYFRNKDTGFVAGTGGVMTTVNGGQTFEALATPLPTAATIYNVYMVNNMVGYVVGTTSLRAAKTTDGGYSWTLNTALPSATYYDVWSPDDILIIVSTTSGNIRRSTDGGATWTAVLTGASATMYKLAFKNATTGYVCGSTSAIRMTTDAGLTWTSISGSIPTGKTFYDLDLVGSNIFLTGDSYVIFQSSDDGVTWNQIDFLAPVAQQPWTATYYATDFLSDRFVTVGMYGLINQKIGTSTPTIYSQFSKAGTLYDVWGESTTGKVIAVGSPGNSTSYDQIMYSTNGGTNWLKAGLTLKSQTTQRFDASDDKTPNSGSTFRAIDMINSNLGYIVGSLGAVYRTTNGGTVWDSVVTPVASTVTLYDVDFVSPEIGWIVGSTGTIYKTTDAGVSWTMQTSALTSIAYSISMANATTGWLAGSSGAVYFTSDGGTTWTAQTSGFGTSTIYQVKAISATTAYLAGASSKVGKTTDGGTTWTLITVPFAASTTIYGMDFYNENIGVLSGTSGRIGMTSDGGTTWTTENTNNNASILYGVKIAVTGTNQRSAFAAGANAYIFKNSLFSVPVELTSFAANVNGNSVKLNWSTSTETNNKGFAVERKTANESYQQITFVTGKGTTTSTQNYFYMDNVNPGKYTYRLKQVDFDGTISYSKEVDVETSAPNSYGISQNYPNPFNPATTIRYQVPVDGFVKIALYNSLGEKVADIVNQVMNAGSYEVNFNASSLTSGIYFYKIEAGSYAKVMKMTILK